MDFSTEQITNFVMTWAPKVLLAIVILIVGFWLIGWIVGRLKKVMTKRGVDKSIRPFLASIVSVLLKVLLLFSIVSMFGVPVASFIAVLGALAFAVGMALQGTLGHFASGVLIIIFKPYEVGDYVSIAGGEEGTVDEVQVFNTKLRTKDNQIIFVPNGLVTSNPIQNITMEDIRRVDMTFGIGYDDDIDKAKKVISGLVEGCPEVLEGEPVDIVVGELGGSSVNIVTKVWCRTDDYWTVYLYMQEQVKKGFDSSGVGMPYPQMDVHLDNVEA